LPWGVLPIIPEPVRNGMLGRTPHGDGEVGGSILSIMNKKNSLAGRIKVGLAIAMLPALTGCIGVVGDGGYYGDGYVRGGWWGGGYDRGRDVHFYSARGGASRGGAHGGGGHGGGGRR